MAALERQLQRRVDGHRPEVLPGYTGDAHPLGLDILVGLAGWRPMRGELGNELVDLQVQFGAFHRRTGDDQRRARLVNEDAVHLVDNGVGQFPLYPVFQSDGQIIPQVVEAEFVVGAVDDVRPVGFLLFFPALAGLHNAHGEPQKLVDRAHPVGVPLGKVVVDGDDVHALAGQRIQVGGECRHQRLAFAGAHLRDLSLVQRDAAYQLHVEVAHTHRAHGRFPNYRKRLGQERFQIFARLQPGSEFRGLRLERVVIQPLDFGLQRVCMYDKSLVAAQQPLVAAAEDVREELGGLFQQATSRDNGARPYSKVRSTIWGPKTRITRKFTSRRRPLPARDASIIAGAFSRVAAAEGIWRSPVEWRRSTSSTSPHARQFPSGTTELREPRKTDRRVPAAAGPRGLGP